MGQQRHETITSYSTRLNGLSYLCDLFMTCPNCNADVSFKEKVIMYQLIGVISDISARESILEAAAQVEGGKLSLIRVMKLAEAFEMGRSSQELVNSTGQISKISDNQLKKREYQNQSRQERAKNDARPPNQQKDQKNCTNCGS